MPRGVRVAQHDPTVELTRSRSHASNRELGLAGLALRRPLGPMRSPLEQLGVVALEQIGESVEIAVGTAPTSSIKVTAMGVS